VAQAARERRRAFLRRFAAGVPVAPWIITAPRIRAAVPRPLSLRHSHTGESLSVVYAAGGVGYYPETNFIHLDTGRLRRW
jgi:uncharacterized protein YcbK (DUF882 family)